MGDIVIYTGDFKPLRGKRGRIVRSEPICKAPDFMVPDGDRKSLIVEIAPEDINPDWPSHWHRYRANPDEITRDQPDLAR
jgi:hypothetical protein